MNANDPVRDFLREEGCGPLVIEGGFPGLIERWENVVQSIEEGYSLGLDDYLNDLDIRQLIAEAMDVATLDERNTFAERIARSDETMRSLLEPAGGCLWGAAVAEEEGWTDQENWWYFSRPINADPELQAEIDEALSES